MSLYFRFQHTVLTGLNTLAGDPSRAGPSGAGDLLPASTEGGVGGGAGGGLRAAPAGGEGSDVEVTFLVAA